MQISYSGNATQQNITLPTEDWTPVYSVVRWIQMIMAILSAIGAGSIIVYASFQKLLRTAEIRPLFLLSVADLLLALSWLIGALLYTEACDRRNICYNLHAVEQILYMASFFYTLNYVWVLYTRLRDKYYIRLNGYPSQSESNSASFRGTVAVISCVLPALLTVPIFITGNLEQCYTNYTQPYKCLLMHTGSLYHRTGVGEEESATACRAIHVYSIAIFLTTFLFTLLGIVGFMGKALSLYKHCVNSHGYIGDTQWATLRVLERRMILYPSAFFFCWGPATILAAIILLQPTAVDGRVGVVLYTLQAFTSASQGLLNCVVYGWTQQHFHSLKLGAVRDADTQTPLLRAQKKAYYSLLSSGSYMQHV
ncbi:transmembrane protein 116 [Denticeps clupeoides]|uniref:G-protein coupled receptors family 1 profile domain-containing protein n=1 Tax=Denticeps clupeoides TaxID=299321 RepID=A0AAY4BBD7_9TELE|nr:transmembrane protein 116 [Denticeps clupeoides]